MRNGFYFKNKHSNDFGVTVQTQSRPIKPEMKIQTYDSPYIDGEYDFSTANAYNREFYKNRVFKMNLQSNMYRQILYFGPLGYKHRLILIDLSCIFMEGKVLPLVKILHQKERSFSLCYL